MEIGWGKEERNCEIVTLTSLTFQVHILSYNIPHILTFPRLVAFTYIWDWNWNWGIPNLTYSRSHRTYLDSGLPLYHVDVGLFKSNE